MNILKVENLDSQLEEGDREATRMHFLLPSVPARIFLVGPPGSGKSMLLANMLLKPMILFHKILYFTPDFRDSKTRLIKKHFDKMQKEFDILCKEEPKTFGKSFPILTISDNLEDLPKVNDINPDNDPKRHCLIVVNDMNLTANTDKLNEIFLRGRHSNISIIFIAQFFFKIPKNFRQTPTDIMIFALNDAHDISRFAAVCATRIDKKEFEKMFRLATKDKFDFLYIEMEAKNINRHIRKNFDQIYMPEKQK